MYLKENGEEDTDRQIVDLAKVMGVEIAPEDISVSHRLPRRGQGVPPVVCRFTRRNIRTKVMMAKMGLKGRHDAYGNVFVADHLTPERARLLRKLKMREDVDGAHSIEGKLRVYMKRRNNTTERVTIDSLDNLLDLGLTEEEMVSLSSLPR